MPEENTNQATEAPLKTEIVAAIPVQEPTSQITESPRPPDQTPPSTGQKLPSQPTAQLNRNNQAKAPRLENYRLILIITVACLVAVGLSIAAVLAFKSSI